MVNTFHHHRGGDSSYTFALTRALEARGHRVIPFAMAHPANQPTGYAAWFPSQIDYSALASGSRFHAARVAATKGLWNLEAARCLERLLEQVRPDIAHFQHIHHHLTPSILTPLERRRIPSVWTLHDYELLCPTGHFFRDGAVCEACRVTRFDRAVRHRCERGSIAASALVAAEKALHRLLGVLERVDRFLTPSAFLRGKLLEYGVSADRVTHLPNFLEPAAPPGPLPPDGYLLFAGRLTPEKGAGVAIDAALEGLPAPLVIVGDGPERLRLETRAASLVRDGRVRFVGAVPHAEMPRWLEGARAVIVPSIWYENFPFAVLEAFAAARPVIASRIGGLPEQVEDGVTGLLVPPGSMKAIREAAWRIWGGAGLAEGLAAAGYARLVERFGSWSHVERLESEYREVLEGVECF
jgi:glycosyltransferase involved in cell wall biosynthesis